MSIDRSIIKKAHELNHSMRIDTKDYIHNNPLASVNYELVLPDKTKHGFQLNYDIRDIMLLASLTQSSVLMTGGTDSGKTTLARLVMNSLFGKEDDGWHRIDFDLDFGKESYSDMDFGVITGGKKMSEGMYSISPFFKMPGIILDEMNRTHAQLANKAIHVFDKDLTLPDGSRVKIGKEYDDGGLAKRYQFHIAAINEGADYAGTFDIDKALRRRTIIEIPMDVFPPTRVDRKKLEEITVKELGLRNTENRFDTVLEIYKALTNGISMHPNARMFKAYMEAFDFCKYSLTGEKGSVASKNGSIHHVCTAPIKTQITQMNGETMQCEFLKTFEYDMCPSVRGITVGVSKNMGNVARGFALIRATKFLEMCYAAIVKNEPEVALEFKVFNPEKFKESLQDYVGQKLEGTDLVKAATEKYLDKLEVEISDIEAAAAFVGYSKIGFAPSWTVKHFQGNQYGAIRYFLNNVKSKFEEGRARPELNNLGEVLQGKASPQVLKGIENYCMSENPWMWATIKPYLDGGKKEETQLQEEVLGFYK